MADDIRMEVRSDPRLLGSVRSAVRRWVEVHDVDPEAVDSIVLAIDEACSNAIRHSYEGRCEHIVELTLRAEEAFLEFVVCDHGHPCPPDRVQRRPLVPPDADELKPGGLGVQLIYEVFDEVSFSSPEVGGNCVLMRLNKPKRG
jgi:anti-sigma regulatory factor (Ser/Thr protein kinase)